MKVAQKLKEPDVPRQVELADPPKHAQVGLEQREQALGAILVYLTTRVFLPRMIDALVPIALHRPIAAGRVRGEPTAHLHRDIGCPLPRLHRKLFGRLSHDSPLAAAPGENSRPVFVLMPPARLALLAATTCAASQ